MSFWEPFIGGFFAGLAFYVVIFLCIEASNSAPPSGERPEEPSQEPRGGGEMDPSTKERLVGELAFQLYRRILWKVFLDPVLLSDFTLGSIAEKIALGGNDPLIEKLQKIMMKRYVRVMHQLKPLGYDPNIHTAFIESLVNAYGILRERPDPTNAKGDTFNNAEFLENIVRTVVPAEKVADCCILISCLSHLSRADGKPLFI